MEEILSRFPIIAQNIFNELDAKDFCSSKEVSRFWNYFIINERALQKSYKRRIQEKIRSLAVEIDNDKNWKQINGQPFHLAANRGYLPVCQEIMENSDDKNPKDRNGWTPLHSAAQFGHFSVCQLIVENVDDKNPKKNDGQTPLHLAVRLGHFSVCQLLLENVDDKNPKDKWGRTPLQLAKNRRFTKIQKLIEYSIENQSMWMRIKIATINWLF